MKTLSVQIEDSYMQKFMNFVDNSHLNITIANDKNLELDQHFYERQKELHKIREDIKNDNMEMLSQEQYNKEIKDFFFRVKKIRCK